MDDNTPVVASILQQIQLRLTNSPILTEFNRLGAQKAKQRLFPHSSGYYYLGLIFCAEVREAEAE